MKNVKNNTKIISVKVITNSKKPKILENDGIFKIWINEKPVEGKANKAVIRSIAEYFNTNPSAIRIVKGEKTAQKLIEIMI
ncbi:MAG: DUF167 domain-containing protein [Patescibacteria group bacterium]